MPQHGGRRRILQPVLTGRSGCGSYDIYIYIYIQGDQKKNKTESIYF